MRQQLALGQSPLDEVVTDDRREASQRRSRECCNRADHGLVHEHAFNAVPVGTGKRFNQLERIAMFSKNSATSYFAVLVPFPPLGEARRRRSWGQNSFRTLLAASSAI